MKVFVLILCLHVVLAEVVQEEKKETEAEAKVDQVAEGQDEISTFLEPPSREASVSDYGMYYGSNAPSYSLDYYQPKQTDNKPVLFLIDLLKGKEQRNPIETNEIEEPKSVISEILLLPNSPKESSYVNYYDTEEKKKREAVEEEDTHEAHIKALNEDLKKAVPFEVRKKRSYCSVCGGYRPPVHQGCNTCGGGRPHGGGFSGSYSQSSSSSSSGSFGWGKK